MGSAKHGDLFARLMSASMLAGDATGGTSQPEPNVKRPRAAPPRVISWACFRTISGVPCSCESTGPVFSRTNAHGLATLNVAMATLVAVAIPGPVMGRVAVVKVSAASEGCPRLQSVPSALQ